MWRLYDLDKNEAVQPIKYENKSQSRLVEEMVELLQSTNIVFLQGAVGTGKSVVALHLIAEYGKGIIQTPTKALESQYERDYSRGNLRILLNEGGSLEVEQLKGRNNFTCPHYTDVRCDYRGLPCIRPLGKRESRAGVASECPYWSPVTRAEYAERFAELLGAGLSKYEAVGGEYGFVHRKENCPFYNQYQAYLKDGVATVMNSALWNIETLSGRKARVPIEIIDEGDAYFDGLCLRVNVTEAMLKGIINKYKDFVKEDLKDELLEEFSSIVEGYKGQVAPAERFSSFLKDLEKLQDITGELDKINIIGDYREEAYAGVFQDSVMFYLAEPSLVLDELMKKSARKLVFMSATFQKLSVLKEVYGLDPHDYAFCFGERKHPGTVYLKTTGSELPVNYRNWRDEEFRRGYFNLRDSIVEKATEPKLIQVWGKKYAEGIDQDFREVNIEEGEDWSTVSSRGIDLTDDKCRSIILLKCPYPDTKDPVLQTMRKKLGDDAFWRYYQDIMRRTLIQQVGRGLRHKDDWIEVWSPDKRVIENIKRVWEGRIA